MCTSHISRRRFLSNTATVGTLPLIGCVISDRPTFDVDLYVDAAAQHGQSVNHAAAFLEQRFSKIYGARLNVGPEGVVEVPAYDTLKELAEWWYYEQSHSAEHASILCVDYSGIPDYWGYSYRYGEPPSVVRFASNMDTQGARWIILHEVGHALGATHNHATAGTIMNPTWGSVDKDDLEYSTKTKHTILQNI